MNFEKNRNFLQFTDENGNTLKYDLKDGEFYKNDNKIKHPQSFFRGHRFSKLLSLIETNHKDLIKFINKKNSRCSNMGTMLQRIKEYDYMESWIYLGLESYIIEDEIKDIRPSDIGKRGLELINNIKDYETVDLEYTNKKYIVTFLINKLSNINHKNIIFHAIEYIKSKGYMDKDIKIIDYLRYNWNNIISAIQEYGCNINALIDYVVFKISVMENYNNRVWTDYIDFLRIQKLLLGKVREKYPKFLRSNHDIIVRIYNDYKREHDEEMFLKMINQSLKYDEILNKEYKIVLPTCTQDLKEEGINLGHCVGSYIDSIINGKRQILFLRHIGNLNESLITIDVVDGKIQQCEGRGRRNPDKEEKIAITRYAKIKKLKEEY